MALVVFAAWALLEWLGEQITLSQVLVGALILVLAFALLAWLLWHLIRADEARKKGQYALLIACYVIVAITGWNEMIGPALSSCLLNTETVTLIHGHRWITYDPIDFDPSMRPNPDIDSLGKELAWIRNAGFDGIITLNSRGNFSAIPELAKKNSFYVIAGVWDPRDRQELAAAISKRKYVDAYCVGHNGLGWRYSYGELVKAIRKIRFQTRRPVSTTEVIAHYRTDKRLFKIGDWVFPDAHVSVKDDNETLFFADAIRDAEKTFEMARLIAAEEERDGKPVLLKMVTYPMGGVPNASLEEQARFFVALLEDRRDVQPPMPIGVSVSVHSAFDIPWKTRWPFYLWDPYTGLLDDAGRPRPAAKEIVRR